MRMPFKTKRARNRIKAREAAAAGPRIPWRAVGRAVAIGGAALATLVVVFWALDQPIRTVEVTGRFQHVSPGDIERVVARQVRGQGLLTVNLAAVSRAIHTLPWVDAVSVERDWPHGLSVLVVEQVAAARWGEDGLVNSSGVLFATAVSRLPGGLARLSGPEGSEAEVTQRYLAMRRRLRQWGLAVTALRLDARGAWQLQLSDGIAVRLGRAQVDERFEKFMTAALGIVEQRAGDISYVDMRYTNGFAVGWRSGRAALGKSPGAICNAARCAGRPRGGAAQGNRRAPVRNARAALRRVAPQPQFALANRAGATDGRWHRACEDQHA